MIEIFRDYRENSTLSRAYYQGEYICLILERPWKNNEPYVSCVSEGVYDLVRYESTKHGDTFCLVNHKLGVGQYEGESDRFGILIHKVTSVNQLNGCLGPGLTTFEPDSVGYSSTALRKLLGVIRDNNVTEISIQKAA